MLVYSILELFTQAASSSAFIFCFCNLIIVIILMDLKPRLCYDQGSEIPVYMARTHRAEENSKGIAQKEEDREVSQDQKKEEKAADNCSNEEDLEVDVEEEIEEEEEDDELRRRVEEFIQKVNKAWKAEFFST